MSIKTEVRVLKQDFIQQVRREGYPTLDFRPNLEPKVIFPEGAYPPPKPSQEQCTSHETFFPLTKKNHV